MIQHYQDNLGGWHELPDISFEHLLIKNNPALTFTKKTKAEYDVAQAAIVPASIPVKQQAQIALNKSDLTMMRCVEAGITAPAAWNTYRKALRAIVTGVDITSTVLPTQPPYPAGT